MKIDLIENTKYGVFMGVGFCLYTTLMWLTNLDSSYLYIGQYFDMAIILLPLLMILLAIHQQNKLVNITILQRVLVALLIGVISYIIYNPFLYVYHNVINPDWFTSVLALKEVELNAANVSAESIAEQLQTMKNSSIANAKIFELSSLIPSAIVLPILISFVSLFLIKNKPPASAAI